MLSKKKKLESLERHQHDHQPGYAGRYYTDTVPRYELPKTGVSAGAAYRLIHDELNLDGNPAMNLATFVSTWMEPEAEKLILETLNKNFVDQDEYPQTEVIQERIINMLARLYNAPEGSESCGTATIGSSEAIMLGLLAHKWTWRLRRQKEGKSTDKPKVIMGADVHTVWEKFARYFDVEAHPIPLESGRYCITAEQVRPHLDENTIAVGAVLGTTFTGQMDDIQGINDLLVTLKKEQGLDIPLHVDGASGGFIVPFVKPELAWDFRLEQVRSINVSNHKFGLVYPGMGSLIFRDATDLPEELPFKINYLGGEMDNYSLNFSRGSAMILAQYYNFLRLGFEGYRRIMNGTVANARFLADGLEAMGMFKALNDRDLFPVVVVRLTDGEQPYTVYDISEELRKRGWIIPAYAMPENIQDLSVMRMVVKENFTRDLCELLLADMKNALETLSTDSSAQGAAGSRHRVC